MSFYNDASLVFLPSGGAGKDGKAYSIKPVPEYGSELVTNGGFDNGSSNWSTYTSGSSNVVFSNNVATINIDGSNSNVGIYQENVFSSGVQYRIVLRAKGSSSFDAEVLESQGAVTQQVISSLSLTTSYQDFVFTHTANGTNDIFIHRLFSASSANESIIIDNVSVKEITTESGDFTFSRGSNLTATRVGPTGLIEKGRENLLLQSNQFDTTWTLGAGLTLTSGQTGYDGSSDAWLYADTATGNSLQQNKSTSGVQTLSIYAKAGTADGIRLRWLGGSGGDAYFNIADASTEAYQSTNTIATKKEDVGSGWFRVSLTFNDSVNTIRIYVGDGSTTSSVSGNIVMQDAQLEVGLAATDYIESGATTGKAGLLENEPRFDYSGGASCPALLLEPQRVQLITQSEYFGGTAWSKQNAILVNTNSHTSPEGIQNATELDGFDSSNFQSVSQYITTDADTYTLSVFLKKTTGALTHYPAVVMGSVYKYVIINSTTGTYAEATGTNDNDYVKIENWNDDWWRVIVTNTISAGSQRFAIYPSLSENGTSLSLSATGTNVFYGAQFEKGSYPTSYIPNHSGTTGSISTRTADSCNGAGDVDTFNGSEGVLYAEFEALAEDSDSKRITISDGTLTNRITISISDGIVSGFINVNNSTQYTFFESGISVTNNTKIALKYRANDFSIWINGSEYDVSATGNTFSSNVLNELSFDNSSGANLFYGKVKQILYFPTALTDAECMTLTKL